MTLLPLLANLSNKGIIELSKNWISSIATTSVSSVTRFAISSTEVTAKASYLPPAWLAISVSE